VSSGDTHQCGDGIDKGLRTHEGTFWFCILTELRFPFASVLRGLIAP
jgi:hypothetical protein